MAVPGRRSRGAAEVSPGESRRIALTGMGLTCHSATIALSASSLRLSAPAAPEAPMSCSGRLLVKKPSSSPSYATPPQARISVSTWSTPWPSSFASSTRAASTALDPSAPLDEAADDDDVDDAGEGRKSLAVASSSGRVVVVDGASSLSSAASRAMTSSAGTRRTTASFWLPVLAVFLV